MYPIDLTPVSAHIDYIDTNPPIFDRPTFGREDTRMKVFENLGNNPSCKALLDAGKEQQPQPGRRVNALEAATRRFGTPADKRRIQRRMVACGDCEFWVESRYGGLGTCHVHAPAWHIDSEGDPVTHWPETEFHEGCGEGQPRKER